MALVLEQHRALAIPTLQPELITRVFPAARSEVIGGQKIVILPHELDTTRILKNLGISTPSPILHYYNWPGTVTPFDHQKETSAFLTVNTRALVLNGMGTGKTLSALWAMDYLMELGEIGRVLIISPLSTLERVWADSLFLNFPHRKFVVLHGTSARRKRLLTKPHDFYIINHDGVQVVRDELLATKFDAVIYDEAAVLRNPSTQRFRIFRRFAEDAGLKRLWMMTGTPTPNEPTDAWSLGKLVQSTNLTGVSYTSFRDRVMMKVGMWQWVPRPEAVDVVYKVLNPAIRIRRQDCLDLPDSIVQTREAELTVEQRKTYNEMFKKFVVEAQAETITAVNEAVKMQKLIQIACGVAYADDGTNVQLDCSHRIKLVEDIIEEANEKVIIYVPLTGTLHMLERELSKRWTVGVVNGQVPPAARNQIFFNFQNTPNPHILIAHPGTASHGLTLTAATTIIWYGPINSNELYEQANARINRIGQNKTTNIVHIESTELERRVFKRLQSKQKLQGLLLDMVQNGTND